MQELEITTKSLILFEELKGATEGSIQLSCRSIDKENFPKVLEQLNSYGKALEKLELTYSSKKVDETYSMTGFDFSKACPNLKTLKVKCCEIGPSVFKHPVLENFRIEFGWITMDTDTVELGSNLSFKSINLDKINCSTQNKTKLSQFIIHQDLKLEEFRYGLGRYGVHCYPSKFIISGSELTKVFIHIHGAWILSLKGNFPHLKEITTISGNEGYYHADYSEVTDESSNYILNLRNEQKVLAGDILIVENTDQLKKLTNNSESNINLVCVKADKKFLKEVVPYLKENGKKVASLNLSYEAKGSPYWFDMKDFDFVQSCPNLSQVNIASCRVGESIFKHPQIETLKLSDSWAVMDTDTVKLGGDINLKKLVLDEVNWAFSNNNRLPKLIINSASKLKYFDYSLDEDSAECYPEIIEVAAPELESIYINVHGTWELFFQGKLSNLNTIGHSCGRYGFYTLDFSGVEEGSSEMMIKIRDGKGKQAGKTWVVLGQLFYNTFEDLFKHVITVYGGKVQAELDENVTHVMLSEGLAEEWESEELETEELVKIKELIDAGNNIDVWWEDSIDEII